MYDAVILNFENYTHLHSLVDDKVLKEVHDEMLKHCKNLVFERVETILIESVTKQYIDLFKEYAESEGIIFENIDTNSYPEIDSIEYISKLSKRTGGRVTPELMQQMAAIT